MKVKKITYLLIMLGIQLNGLLAQKVEFTLKYDEPTQLYEVYGKADFTDTDFFVGGGSQLSIILPTGTMDYPLAINSVAGGPWTDNSQVYTPAADRLSDYHGIATNGAKLSFEAGQEQLLFTFQLPKSVDKKGVRLFDNEKDPHFNGAGMQGADFCNYFACALTVRNVYHGIYDEETINSIKNNELSTPLETTLAPHFDLYQNTPNPFKESTTIGFVLPEASPITLTLRDASGRVLRTIKENRKAGQHSILINEKDLIKGWMIYQLDTKFGSKNKKMIQLE